MLQIKESGAQADILPYLYYTPKPFGIQKKIQNNNIIMTPNSDKIRQ